MRGVGAENNGTAVNVPVWFVDGEELVSLLGVAGGVMMLGSV